MRRKLRLSPFWVRWKRKIPREARMRPVFRLLGISRVCRQPACLMQAVPRRPRPLRRRLPFLLRPTDAPGARSFAFF